MTGCSYCGRPGCGWETCPERLEDRHGVPSDYDVEGQLKTDGGEYQTGRVVQPHPYELEKSVTTDHVAVFSFPDDNTQLEVSGSTDVDELDIDWTTIELAPSDVTAVLSGGEVYTERCEDLAGREYEIQIRGGERHPKGMPVHTNGGESA